MKEKLVTVGCIFALCGAHAESGNLIQNGSFESPGLVGYQYVPGGSSMIVGWTTLLDGVERWSAAYPSVPVVAADGELVLDLNPDLPGGGGIEQVIATQPGQAYSLTFQFGTSTAAGQSGHASLQVLFGDQQRDYSIDTPSATVEWFGVSTSFVATSPVTTLRFSHPGSTNGSFSIIDDVVVSAVPEPSSLLMLGVGVLAIGFQRKVHQMPS